MDKFREKERSEDLEIINLVGWVMSYDLGFWFVGFNLGIGVTETVSYWHQCFVFSVWVKRLYANSSFLFK